MGALAIRVAEQKEALDRAGELVKPGGRICYATCLLLAEENDDRARIHVSARRPCVGVGPADDTAPHRHRRSLCFYDDQAAVLARIELISSRVTVGRI